MKNKADYMSPYEGESKEDYIKRLSWDFKYARGGNHPEDIARWEKEYSAEWWADTMIETWGLNEEDEEETPKPSDTPVEPKDIRSVFVKNDFSKTDILAVFTEDKNKREAKEDGKK